MSAKSFVKKYWNYTSSKNDNDINNFYTIFDEILNLLKSNLREKDFKEAKPLLDRVKRSNQLATFGVYPLTIPTLIFKWVFTTGFGMSSQF